MLSAPGHQLIHERCDESKGVSKGGQISSGLISRIPEGDRIVVKVSVVRWVSYDNSSNIAAIISITLFIILLSIIIVIIIITIIFDVSELLLFSSAIIFSILFPVVIIIIIIVLAIIDVVYHRICDLLCHGKKRQLSPTIKEQKLPE